MIGFNPKVFFVGVGTAFPMYKGKFGANAEGVMGIGGSDANLPGIKWYIQHHKEIIGREPDRWASPITYASLQVLQQAIERVGKIDRAAVIKEINTGSFDTIIGKVKLVDGQNRNIWAVGQWQGNDFFGVAPVGKGTAPRRRSCQAGVAVSGLTRGDGTHDCSRFDIVLSGLVLGGMYALIALGLTLQYGVARIMNLSYGEFLVAAAFAALFLYTGMAVNPLLGLLVVVPAAFAAQLAALPDRADAAGAGAPRTRACWKSTASSAPSACCSSSRA